MKTWKIISRICLVMALIASLAPQVFAALLTGDRQAVILQGSSGDDTSGVLSFSRLLRIKPDGVVEPFVLPHNKDLIVTWINLQMNAIDTTLATNADLRMGPHYSRALAMSNGGASFTEGLDPGFIISSEGFADPRFNNFYSVNLKNDTIIPGKINVRVIGYLVPVP